ncbi:MAG: ThiF family adenylyltransferase [Candidatus Delongbacteria bacterium]|jgi:hypothetical protein|nr:ThiF family adenylyltransferase [Candidatus Delongbacteria bacterium]
MSLQLINHSPDLKKLLDERYEVEVKDGHLLVNHIPYLNKSIEVRYGTLVSILNLSGNRTRKPDDHVVFFKGEIPCKKNGSPISSIINSTKTKRLSDDLIVDHLFSSKPRGGAKYENYYDKMTTYINIISAPAISLHSDLTAKTSKVFKTDESESVFHYHDTNSSRSEINIISSKLENQNIGIVGLGGTGSYILDLIAKTHVKEIRLFDSDIFLQHNAFRSPGAPPIEILERKINKAEYFCEIYSNMHKNITFHKYNINLSNLNELLELDFVFVCIDSGECKESMFAYLIENNIQFIDVGIGVQIIDDKLIGNVRVTSCSDRKNDHIMDKVSFADDVNNAYTTNIQIADLNALNATLAVIKWKKMLGFYQDLTKENNIVYSINVNLLAGNDNDP